MVDHTATLDETIVNFGNKQVHKKKTHAKKRSMPACLNNIKGRRMQMYIDSKIGLKRMSSAMKSPNEEHFTHELHESTKKKAKILQKFLKGEISRE